jgi:hypothetical protein
VQLLNSNSYTDHGWANPPYIYMQDLPCCRFIQNHGVPGHLRNSPSFYGSALLTILSVANFVFLESAGIVNLENIYIRRERRRHDEYRDDCGVSNRWSFLAVQLWRCVRNIYQYALEASYSAHCGNSRCTSCLAEFNTPSTDSLMCFSTSASRRRPITALRSFSAHV